VAVRCLPYRNSEASLHQYSKNHSLLFAACRRWAESSRAQAREPRASAAHTEGSAALGGRHQVFCGFCHGLKPFREEDFELLPSGSSIPLS